MKKNEGKRYIRDVEEKIDWERMKMEKRRGGERIKVGDD